MEKFFTMNMTMLVGTDNYHSLRASSYSTRIFFQQSEKFKFTGKSFIACNKNLKRLRRKIFFCYEDPHAIDENFFYLAAKTILALCCQLEVFMMIIFHCQHESIDFDHKHHHHLQQKEKSRSWWSRPCFSSWSKKK